MSDFNPTQIAIQKIRDDERRKIVAALRDLRDNYHVMCDSQDCYDYGVSAIWDCIYLVEDGLDD